MPMKEQRGVALPAIHLPAKTKQLIAGINTADNSRHVKHCNSIQRWRKIPDKR